MRLVTELYGAGLARVVELVEADAADLLAGWSTTSWSPACWSCTASTPTTLRDAGRARRSSRCGRSSATHGGDVELLDVDERSARCTCACSAAATGARRRRSRCSAVERAIVEAAPEIVIIDVEEPSTEAPTAGDDRSVDARPQAAAPRR